MYNVMGIRENVKALKDEISEVALRSGRNPDDITLVAVSKTFQEEHVREGYDAGLRVFGENRIQEAEGKINNIKDLEITWNLVGHLQSNKAKKAVGLFSMIQSIDKISTLEKVDIFAGELGKKQNILIEVNTSGEGSKFGIDPADVSSFLSSAKAYSHVQINGLMTIGPFTEDISKIRDSFLVLRDKYQEATAKFPQLEMDTLSMGMTDDFKVAIECGSNMIRIGRKIFGSRSMM
ncbi:MAG: YggS family pyridoxal phosphate-dependent enzyme [Spirochaetes bacterium]|nr:YggS family pyridoxal phosphate-dependent enzyme [Spirochaetota bacterium]